MCNIVLIGATKHISPHCEQFRGVRYSAHTGCMRPGTFRIGALSKKWQNFMQSNVALMITTFKCSHFSNVFFKSPVCKTK